MTFFDFVVGVIVGTVAANTAINLEHSFVSGITILTTLTLLVILIDYLSLKNFLFLKVTDSEPMVIIENGKLIEENMRRERLNLPDLMMLLREKNAFNIGDVEYAVFETDGKLSVLLKSQKRPVSPEDLGLSTNYIGLTRDIILDGKILTDNLTAINLTEDWLITTLKQQGIDSPNDVFYAGLDTRGILYTSLKEKKTEVHGQHGLE